MFQAGEKERKQTPPPQSCDTFAVLPPASFHSGVIFGKNSDRPSDEIQNIAFYPRKQYPKGEKLKCTYLEIDQVEETKAVLLCQPFWMWG
eukprot:Cvel_34894.t1-p1 / transcript=Cvel_34894.t1 / gene=Cvel_34894 / organism=Chromera_velia_CCMP2878 / gene_product=Secernin-2, putative / transcript_product=Secernin-2, putative / location=Cvel_scaffold6156:2718-3293(+) / protein_length=89 / sequence_SO=supercontig / SO=protein_coding / is_pseudo=false